MVQGGEHGGSVACPIAARIMERSLAMDEGKFDAQVAWLPPAYKANPFQMIKDSELSSDSGINKAAVTTRMQTTRKAQMCRWPARAGIPTSNRKQIHKGK